MELTPAQQQIVLKFIDETFDVRLRLAFSDQVFASKSPEWQRHRGHVWLTHYSSMVMKLLDGFYDELYPQVITFMAQHSKYYSRFQARK